MIRILSFGTHSRSNHTCDARRLGILAVLAMVAASCSRDEPTQPQAPALASVSPSNELADIPALSRFLVDVAAGGTLTPNSPIQLDITATGIVDTRDVEFALSLPEVEVMRQVGAPEAFAPPINTALPKAQDWHQRLAAGEQIRRRFTVTIPNPGYYRVVASAFMRSDEPAVLDGRFVQDVAHKEIWLFVDSGGGRVTSSFDPKLLPNGVLPHPGPFRHPAKRGNLGASSLTSGAPAARAQMLDQPCRSLNVVCGNVVYYDYDAGAYAPVPSAYIHGDYVDRAYGTHTGGWNTYTEADGYYEIPCNGGPATYYESTMDANNYGVGTVFETSMGDYAPYAGDNCDWNDGGIITNGSEVARVFVNLNVTVAQSRAFFGFARDNIDVVLYLGSSMNDPTYFSSSDLRIHLNRQYHIWGAYGIFALAHEYGHALQYATLGGLPATNCGTHTLTSVQSWNCALAEGWADYHALAARGPASQFYSEIEANSARSLTPAGGRIEETVAGLLFDLSDGANESPHDVVQYPGHYVADVVRTCKVKIDGSWFPNYSIAHLIFCFENNFDSAAWDTYYGSTGGTKPQALTNSATLPTGWNASAVRTAWLWNLFGQ